MDKFKKLEIQEKFQEELNKKVGTISEITIEGHWNKLKMTVTKTAKEILELQKRQRKEVWFDDECRGAIDTRNQLGNVYKKKPEEGRKISTRREGKLIRCAGGKNGVTKMNE